MGEIDLIKTAYGFVDKLTMVYNGNQLITVSDSIAESTNRGVDSFFIDGVDDTEEYTYDANGNTTSDKNKGISEIIYNELNMPQSIYFNNGHITEYLYDASGQKLRVIYKIDNRTLYAPEEIGDLPEDESAIEAVMTRDYIGNHVYEDGILERTFIANGYITGTDTYNFYIKDYQGNNVLTVEEQAAGVEGNHMDYNLYYPYGSPTRRNYDDRYMYSGKELDDMNGLRLYDFSARSYDAIITRFLSPDPMRSKYPHISHYVHCANNPLIYIDPTGNDIWYVDDRGQIVKVEKFDKFDKFVMVGADQTPLKDSNGNEISISFDYGTIISQKSYEYEKDKTYDVYKVRGDGNATRLFEFMSENITGSDSKVEIGLTQTGIAGDKGLNFITTGHIEKREPGFSKLWAKQLGYLYNVRMHTHSHPLGSNPSDGDMRFVEGVINHLNDNKPLFNNKWYMAMPKFRIYHVPTKKYINYNQNGIIK